MRNSADNGDITLNSALEHFLYGEPNHPEGAPEAAPNRMAYNRAEEDHTFLSEEFSQSQRDLALAAFKNEMSKQNQKRYE